MREKYIKSKKGLFIIVCFVAYTLLYIINNEVIKLSVFSYFKATDSEPIYTYVYKGTEDYLINTTACYMPNYTKKIKFTKIKNTYKTCGKRAVFISHDKENNTITFQIESKIMEKYIKGPYDCCYSYATRSTETGKEDTELNYTKCMPFTDGETTDLDDEVVTVTCYDANKKRDTHSIIYKDAYIFITKVEVKANYSDDSWNVLLVGMDTMSRARVYSTMPRTTHFLQEHGWLDYKGYTKIGPNTFPNLIGMLSGKKLSKIYKTCSSGLDNCNDLIIWSKFRKAGYITAYGEDNLRLPDTFSRYNGFKTKPTNHYMRPFFLTGEQHIGNTICTEHKPSGKHILDYASDFVNTYRDDKFFGLFWVNSYSHNLDNIPTNFDSDIVEFFQQLAKIGIMNNTFVVFFSDHGIRFGEMRLPMESYYEERLPMFFLWTPHTFRDSHPDRYYNLQVNQNRLTSPYDFHATLDELSNAVKDDDDVESEACPQCSSLFEEKTEDRTCPDAGIDEKWCCCHSMTKVDAQTHVANDSLHFAVSYIQKRAEDVETTGCWKCANLTLNRLIRNHWYVDDKNRTNYVIAFEMVPGKVSFEVNLVENSNELEIVGPTDTISAYNTRGNCVKIPSLRAFCVCEKINGCKHGR